MQCDLGCRHNRDGHVAGTSRNGRVAAVGRPTTPSRLSLATRRHPDFSTSHLQPTVSGLLSSASDRRTQDNRAFTEKECSRTFASSTLAEFEDGNAGVKGTAPCHLGMEERFRGFGNTCY